jgi:hypothetical protein
LLCHEHIFNDLHCKALLSMVVSAFWLLQSTFNVLICRRIGMRGATKAALFVGWGLDQHAALLVFPTHMPGFVHTFCSVLLHQSAWLFPGVVLRGLLAASVQQPCMH